MSASPIHKNLDEDRDRIAKVESVDDLFPHDVPYTSPPGKANSEAQRPVESLQDHDSCSSNDVQELSVLTSILRPISKFCKGCKVRWRRVHRNKRGIILNPKFDGTAEIEIQRSCGKRKRRLAKWSLDTKNSASDLIRLEVADDIGLPWARFEAPKTVGFWGGVIENPIIAVGQVRIRWSPTEIYNEYLPSEIGAKFYTSDFFVVEDGLFDLLVGNKTVSEHKLLRNAPSVLANTGLHVGFRSHRESVKGKEKEAALRDQEARRVENERNRALAEAKQKVSSPPASQAVTAAEPLTQSRQTQDRTRTGTQP